MDNAPQAAAPQNPEAEPPMSIGGLAAAFVCCTLLVGLCVFLAGYASPRWASPGGEGWTRTSKFLTVLGWFFAIAGASALMSLLGAVWRRLTQGKAATESRPG